MDFSETTKRISQKISAKGHSPDNVKIEMKLKRLVEEFGVPPAEAERTVTNELAREYSITGMGTGSSEKKQINEVLTGEWITVEGKVVALSESPSPAIAQTGLIADATGAIRFVTWAKARAPLLELGKWYRLESAVVDEFKGSSNLKIHSGTTIREIPADGSIMPQVTPIGELTPGIASIRGKVIQDWEVTHERMLQAGVLADESGTVRFVIWKEEGKERLSPGSVYSVFYTLVDEYNGRLSLTLNTATIIPEEGDISVSGGNSVFSGAFVHLAPGSGLIKRCPVDGCNRVLSRQNYCPVHEIQPNFSYDLRIKGWLDNGQATREILIPREGVEALTGISREQAKELAENNPLGMEEVFLRVRERVLGRYLTCSGREIDQRLLASSCEYLHYNPGMLPDLINRAGGAYP